ncbi:MAG: bifunctional diaminohydroxyphosphoribosylaminopyrimidine deaminase/5-amino-6-(5-phosphoribosylamino)uracil reductase RibD [Lentisphaeria bacterium]
MENNSSKYMARALELANLGWGMTSPNPMVGAVIVHDNTIISEGYHQLAGLAHAEVDAISKAAFTKNCDLYVTLEPCSSFGKTPPCTQAIIEAGFKRVFIGCLDPNPKHAGKGVEILQQANIEVVVGVLEAQCHELNRHFFHWVTTKKPYVILKMAMTIDGKIATKSGKSQWITSPASRSYVQKLRRFADAIMVGGETVRVDNPSLTVREPENWERQPLKIVATRDKLDHTLKIFDLEPPMVVALGESWESFLLELGSKNITCLLIEGGGELAALALEAKVVNQVYFMIAPMVLGGRESRSVVGGKSPDSLSDAIKISNPHCEQIGVDFIISGELIYSSAN